MLAHLVERLQTLQKETPFLDGILRGIERECLRATPESTLAPTSHSIALGSKLTHPHITTDYSENLLEFITSPHHTVDKVLEELLHLHAFTAQAIPDERLWPMSMPCILGKDLDIPIADYGNSNSGQMKMHYRRGLSHRYGRHMQCIAGLHYNFSFSNTFWEMWQEKFDPCHRSLQDCIDANYMRMIRNYLKHAWLIFTVMGASPACDRSFFVDTPPEFLTFLPPDTYYAPHACSLRMSKLGYQSHVQDNICISYNSLEQYIRDLQQATALPSAQYKMITEKYGEMAQLNANILQIEAELYAPIRPKQVVQLCERPTKALKARGIQYIEVRGIDVNPLSPIGITAEQIRFLDTFLMFCLLHNSPTFTLDNAMQWHNNQAIAVLQGLTQDCTLQTGNRSISANEWGLRVFDQLQAVAVLLDNEDPAQLHLKAIQQFQACFVSRDALPASIQMESIIKDNTSFIDYGRRLAETHHQTLMNIELSEDVKNTYEAIAKASLVKQNAMEDNKNMSYEEYLRCYFS